MRRISKILIAGLFCMAILNACGKNNTGESGAGNGVATEAATEAAEDETVMVKGDVDKRAVLLVSFEASRQETREMTIDQIAGRIRSSYPDYEVRQAYASQTVIDKIKDQEGLEVDHVEAAVRKLIDEGYGTLVIQPIHVIAGNEYTKMQEDLAPYTDYFVQTVTGQPLLTAAADFQPVIWSLLSELISYTDNGVSFVLVGHGSDHSSNAVYAEFENAFREQGLLDYYVGTIEAEPGVEEVLSKIRETDTRKVVLIPLMIAAGDHAVNDAAGDNLDSWKTQFEAAGYEVECVPQGMGAYTGIQEVFLTHIQNSLDSLPE